MFFSLVFRLSLTNGFLATEQARGDNRCNQDTEHHPGFPLI
jgi:hypothetical protein